MEEVFLGLLILGFVIGGWVLGVVGFFSSRRALREIAVLRAGLAASPAPGVSEVPVSVPVPETPIPEVPVPQAPVIAVPEAVEPEPEPLPGPPPPEAAPEPAQARPARPDIEALLTTRWGVWLGSAALLMAGVFLIRYAVEEGLLGPAARCVLAALLGVALIAAAEWLGRREAARNVLTDRAAPGLAAGGVAILFGAAYGAGPLYGLVPPLLGFAMLAAASIAGLALALRQGQLVAAVGIVGAFISPALVASAEPSVPALFVYLLFVSAAALAVVRYTAWIWLGWATTIAGAAWALIAIAAGDPTQMWAAALFLPIVATLNLGLLPSAALDHPVGRHLAWVPCAVLGFTCLVVELAVPGWAERAAVLLFAPVLVGFAAREPRLTTLPFLGALLFLLLLATWSLDLWTAPDISFPPETWVPPDVGNFLWTAGIGAGLFAAAGLWFERHRPHPLAWASLAASVPVLTLAVGYLRVARFEPRLSWALVALAVAGGLAAAAAAAMREQGEAGRQRAGVHAAGAVAALALGCGMLLADQWLTLAVSLFLPALAWIEAKAELPALRHVALAVAVVVVVRLLLNRFVLDYAFGGMPVLNGLLPAYGVPAAAFALAAVLFRRRGDDLAVGVLEGGSVAFATALVTLEIRHFATGGELTYPDTSFLEAGLHVASLAVLAVAMMQIATRLDRPVLMWGWRIEGAVALAGAIGLIAANPAFTGDPVGQWPIFDWLLPAYLLPALLALFAMTQPGTRQPPWLRPLLGGYALIAGFVWLTLEVRHLFHPDAMGLDDAPVGDADLWAWSGAWLVYGAALMAGGIWVRSKPLRLAALAIIGLTAAKVFLVDMADLVGLWRVLSFLGLGLTLIALGAVYRRFVGEPEAPD